MQYRRITLLEVAMVVTFRLDDVTAEALDWIRQEEGIDNRSDAIRWAVHQAVETMRSSQPSAEVVVESKARPVVTVLLSGMSRHEQEDKLNSYGSLGYRLVSVVSHDDDLVAYLQAE